MMILSSSKNHNGGSLLKAKPPTKIHYGKQYGFNQYKTNTGDILSLFKGFFTAFFQGDSTPAYAKQPK